MTVPFVIRDYITQDFERVIDLKWQMNTDEITKAGAAGHPLVEDIDATRHAAEETVARHIAISLAGQGLFLVAESESQVIGYCAVKLDTASTTIRQQHREHAFISGLVVDAERRGCGIGSALIAAAEDWARTRGPSRLLLQVSTSNTAAQRFYERLDLVPMQITMGKALSFPDPSSSGEQ